MYKTEEEFLKNYNSDDFEKLSMTADILIFSVSSEESTNYRKTDKKKMSILLVKRDNYPFKDKWCLPGGFIDIKENLDDAPIRILKNEINLVAKFPIANIAAFLIRYLFLVSFLFFIFDHLAYIQTIKENTFRKFCILEVIIDT